jgi:tetratricopeptide (TPR) repeat protein
VRFYPGVFRRELPSGLSSASLGTAPSLCGFRYLQYILPQKRDREIALCPGPKGRKLWGRDVFVKKRGGIFRLCIVVCAVFSAPSLFAQAGGQSLFQKGEELFMQNKPREAAAFLENALKQEPRNEKIYLYLGISYEQTGNRDKAIAIMQKGLDFAVLHKDLLYFNIANNYYGKGEGEKAFEMYSKAIEENGSLNDAYLNRANTAVKLDKLEEALGDYRLYLVQEPDTAQRPKIEQLIRLLEGIQTGRVAEALRLKAEEEERLRAEEEKKRVAEEQKRLEEERKKQEEEELRVAEEKRRQEEQARQKALLEEVLKSLQMSTEDASHLSAEKEDIIEERNDVDIDD